MSLPDLLPRKCLTRMAGHFARARLGALTQAAIQRFVAHYNVDMSQAANPDLRHYATFNDFFTRALRPDARPLASGDWLCPVDGAISQFGDLAGDQIFQAKGHWYGAQTLLATDADDAAGFTGGQFACLYLSPRDYHRVHMPCDGRLLSMTYVPGTLYSVNPKTASRVPGLFARNERVVCRFDTPHGAMALVLVGATIVGSMATVWHGVVNPPRGGQIRHFDYTDQNIQLSRGAEMGRFMLGSTVVMLWPRNTLRFNPGWAPAGTIRMGEAMASRVTAPEQVAP